MAEFQTLPSQRRPNMALHIRPSMADYISCTDQGDLEPGLPRPMMLSSSFKLILVTGQRSPEFPFKEGRMLTNGLKVSAFPLVTMLCFLKSTKRMVPKK